MIKHYLKVAFRNLLKYKTQSLISIIGLAVGFTCFALSALWIRYEMTYDTFHEGADRLYLAGNKFQLRGDGFTPYTSAMLADYIKKNCPEVESACHAMYNIGSKQVTYNEAEWQMNQMEVDSNFISMFNIHVLDGSSSLQLAENQIAITEKAAKRIFGNESPIGKQLVFPKRNQAEKTIVAVVQSWQGHSAFPFDILLPFPRKDGDWGVQNCLTLFRVYPGSNISSVEQRLEEITPQEGWIISAPIVLLSALRSTHPKDVDVKLNHIRLFACIGALVILCGLCNYLTMLVTRIRMRKRELALRKVNGASGGSLLWLLLSELLALLFIALGVGNVLVELILPVFKRLSQIDEPTSFFYREVFVYMLSLVVVTTGIAAILIRCVNRQTLLNNINRPSNLHLSGWFYRASIVFQLFISISFIFCTLLMMKQLNFLLNSRELGLDRHNIGVIASMAGLPGVPFTQILDQMPEVERRLEGFSTPIPKMGFSTFRMNQWEGKTEQDAPIDMEYENINQDYADFFGVEVLQGSMLNEKDGKEMVVINETAARRLGWNDAVGKKLQEYTVKGVIKDIYYNAPIYPVSPAFFSLPEYDKGGHIVFKVKEGTWDTVARKLREEARKANPNSELWLVNMEETYNGYMKSETTLSHLLSAVSGVCIVIALFGIFSLVTLSCEQRRKEIAIRKVNGASVKVILRLFFKEYLALLIIASGIAFPLSSVLMKHWLEGYVKQTPIGFGLYGGIFAGMIAIIFLSVIWRVWKAARQNPAEVIKSE